MIRLTSTLLKELGCTNVIGANYSCIILNGVPVAACDFIFNSIDEVQHTDWFMDAVAGAMLLVCDSAVFWDIAPENKDKVFLRIYSIAIKHGEPHKFDDDSEGTMLWAYRNRLLRVIHA
jgi:hypothetical protein